MKKNSFNNNPIKSSLCAYLVAHEDGNLSSLNKFDSKEITHFCKLGFLTRGKDSQNMERYKLTALGKKQVRIMHAQQQMSGAFDTIIKVLG